MTPEMINEDAECRKEEKRITSNLPIEPKTKPFPYWPPQASEEEMKRMEVMLELNKWANNDSFMAKRAAETLILLLSDQFSVNLLQLEK